MLNLAEYHVGLTDVKYGQLASNLFLPKNKINTKEGKLIGYIVNQINLGITGVTISYLLSATGRDKAILKGTEVTSIAWLVLYGLTSRLNITVKSRNKRAPLLSFIDHITLGVLYGWLIPRLGDNALFPDIKQDNSNEKIPMFSTNKKFSQCENPYAHDKCQI